MAEFLKKKKEVFLRSGRLYLKTLHIEDISKEYINGLNDEEVNRYLEVRFQHQSHATVNDFVTANLNSEDSLLMGIYINETDHFIGTIRLSHISFTSARSNLGICIFAKEYWGQGFGLEALERAGEFVFSEMGMQYIYAGVYEENISSVSMFEKAGYELHERVSDTYKLNGQYAEVLMLRKVNTNLNYQQVEDSYEK